MLERERKVSMATSCPEEEEPSLATPTVPRAANPFSAPVSQVAQPVSLNGGHFLCFSNFLSLHYCSILPLRGGGGVEGADLGSTKSIRIRPQGQGPSG